MNFLRDYLFQPMVNTRIRLLPRRLFPLQYFSALLLTMVLCGLWHGASWTFVLWGAMHGCALVLCSLWRRYGPRLPAVIGWALTVMFVIVTGVIFRAGTVAAAWNIFGALMWRRVWEAGGTSGRSSSCRWSRSCCRRARISSRC